MNRRGFIGSLIATAGGLFVPYEPERVYSFIRRPVVPVSSWLRIYAGAVPTGVDAALGRATLLAEMRLHGSTFPLATNGIATFEPAGGPAVALATGIATFARVEGADDGSGFVQFPVRGPCSDGEFGLQLNTTCIPAYAEVKVSRLVVTA